MIQIILRSKVRQLSDIFDTHSYSLFTQACACHQKDIPVKFELLVGGKIRSNYTYTTPHTNSVDFRLLTFHAHIHTLSCAPSVVHSAYQRDPNTE